MNDRLAHPGVRQSWKSLRDSETVSNSPRNGPESTKTATVDDRHISAPRGSSIVEITLGPQNSEFCPRNGPESAKTATVDDRQLSAWVCQSWKSLRDPNTAS